MAPALSQPLLLFCQAILLGMAAALLYDLLRAFRLRLPRLTSALDILYCMAAGLAVFLFMLRRAQGQLRLYLLLGAVGGGVLFFTAFSPFLRPVWDFWVDTLAFLLHLTAIPLRGAENLCKKIGRWGKNLFYFIRKCYTIKTPSTAEGFTKEAGGMARAGRQPKKRSRGSVLTKLLILVILAAIGLQLRSLHSQVQDAQAQRDALTAQVQAQEQENAALAADIAEGATEDKMKEIAQEELGLISPNQRVFSVGN